jgi:ferritin-like protein
MMKTRKAISMDISNYSAADTTHVYYYTLTRDAFTGEEHRAENRKDLENKVKQGTVFSFREVTSKFYFANK